MAGMGTPLDELLNHDADRPALVLVGRIWPSTTMGSG
jgi:hypothetical protein